VALGENDFIIDQQMECKYCCVLQVLSVREVVTAQPTTEFIIDLQMECKYCCVLQVLSVREVVTAQSTTSCAGTSNASSCPGCVMVITIVETTVMNSCAVCTPTFTFFSQKSKTVGNLDFLFSF